MRLGISRDDNSFINFGTVMYEWNARINQNDTNDKSMILFYYKLEKFQQGK